MSKKEVATLLVSGAAITGAVFAAPLTGGLSLIGPEILNEGLKAFGGLGGNLVANAVQKHFIDNHPQEDVLKNGDLTRAVGSAIFKLCGKLAEETSDGNDKKSLEKLAATKPEVWEDLLIGGGYEEGYGLSLSYRDLSGVSAEKLVQYVNAKAENLDEIKSLTPLEWQGIIKTLCEKQKCSLTTNAETELANKLHLGFAEALRKVLITDFGKDGKAYASMQFRILNEILNYLSEILLYSKQNYEQNEAILALVVDLSKKVSDINQTSPRNYTLENKEDWKKIFDDFDSFQETLGNIYQDTQLIIKNQAKQDVKLEEIKELVSQKMPSESFLTSEFFNSDVQEINQVFLETEKNSEEFNAESFYLANYPAQWWGILNDFDEKTKLFHDVKKQIEENFYYYAPIVAYLRGSGGTGKTTLARQLVVDFVLNEKSYDCWWIECRDFENEELVYIEKHLKEINESRNPTLFVLDDWSKFDNKTKTFFRKLFERLNKNGGYLKFVISDRKLNNSELPTNLFSHEPYFFDKRTELDVDNNSILQKVFDVFGEDYKELSEQLFSEDEISTAKPFFLLYVLIRVAKDRNLLNHLFKETQKAERYFKEIVEFDLIQLSKDKERQGLVSAIGFIAYLRKKHKHNITKNAFLLLANRYSQQNSAFDLINDYQNKPIKQWHVVGQYFYAEKSIRNKRENAPYYIAFNKDDFIDAILESNVFDEFISVSEYIDEHKAAMSNFLIEKGDEHSASVLTFAFCHREETLKHKSQEIIQKLLDNKNSHHSYTKVFFWADNNFISDEQKWKWIEQYLRFSKENHFFQLHCVIWLKKVYENNKKDLLTYLNKLEDLGAKSNVIINAILKTTEGKENINKARKLLESNKDGAVICACLEILKNESDSQDIARNLLKTNKDKSVIRKCLDILKKEIDVKDIARNLLETNKDHQEVIFICLEILKDESEIKDIVRNLLESNKDKEVICVCLEILKSESDAQNIARNLLKSNPHPFVICKCLPILKDTQEGKKYALNILNDWKNKDNNMVIRSLEVLAGTKESEEIIKEITKEIIRNHQRKFKIYSIIMSRGHGNYDFWQKEVKQVIKNWWKNSELVVGHCLRHSEDNYFDTETVCLGYLRGWKKRIIKIKGTRKPVFYFMTKSLAHPYLRKEAKATAREMLEYEKNNKGFLPDGVRQVAEDIVERNIFPEWHTKAEIIENDG